ncbi:translation initiation factor IF-2 [Streptomyces sp. NPDC018610]|uniref:translation initiation factor IF-2 n=1 Tax=Streptomyces sp. NPDC018610 TaxID=3365049 RepID=UPI0037A4A77D
MRVKKGLEQARPEWPVAASATGAVPALETGTVDGGGVGGDVQSFPKTGAVPALRVEDPWERSGPDGHDPGELTVRLDRAGAGPDRPDGPGGLDGDAGGSDGPVFVDESGRRSRRFRRIGMAVGLTCGVYAVVIAVTLVSGNSNAPWLPVPGQADQKPAGKVDTSPAPSDSVLPSGTGGGAVAPGRPGLPGVSGAPGVSATAAGGAGPSTTAGTSAPPSSAGPKKPAASAGAKPPATTPGRPKPPGTGAAGPTTVPTPPPASASPDPTPSSGGGSAAPGPSTSPGGGDGGSGGPGAGSGGPGAGSGAVSSGPGTVADGPGSPVPVTSEPAPAQDPGPTTDPGPTAPPGPGGSASDGAGARSLTASGTVA